MKKIFFVFAIITGCLCTSCSDDNVNKDQIIGSEAISKEERSFSEYQNVVVGSIIDLNITFGESPNLQVTANANIINKVFTEVRDNTLFLSLEDGNYTNISISVDITIPDLSELNNEGTGDITIKGFDNLDELSIESIGTGDIILEGSVDILTIELKGIGNFNGFEFIAKSTSIDHIGTGDIEVFCSESLYGSLTGTGNLYYIGEPSIDVTVTGTGDVIDAN